MICLSTSKTEASLVTTVLLRKKLRFALNNIRYRRRRTAAMKMSIGLARIAPTIEATAGIPEGGDAGSAAKNDAVSIMSRRRARGSLGQRASVTDSISR